MKRYLPLLLLFASCTKSVLNSVDDPSNVNRLQVVVPPGRPLSNIPSLYYPNNVYIHYVGEWFSNRTWAAGAYVQFGFIGTDFTLLLNDEQRPGYSMVNFVTVTDNGLPILTPHGKTQWVLPKRKAADPYAKDSLVFHLLSGSHTITVTKSKESSQGWIEFAGVRTTNIGQSDLPPDYIVCIGDSWMVAWGSNKEFADYGADWTDQWGNLQKGHWSTNEDAYFAFPRQAAIALNAQPIVIAGVGMGLFTGQPDPATGKIRTMPMDWRNGCLYNGTMPYNLAAIPARIVNIMLGQNDGFRDSVTFCRAYVSFVDSVKKTWPNAEYVLAATPSDPAVSKFRDQTIRYVHSIVAYYNRKGDAKVHDLVYSGIFGNQPGDILSHPNINEQAAIAKQFSDYVKTNITR